MDPVFYCKKCKGGHEIRNDGAKICPVDEREKLEWSLETPLSRRWKTGQCPWCAAFQHKGHDEDCAFLDPSKSIEDIKREIAETHAENKRAEQQYIDFLTGSNA